jgi:hypothetical protein
MTLAVISILVIGVLIVGLIGFVIAGFNKLRTADIGAQEALGGIDVQLTRRAELIPNLVNTVKGYATHELNRPGMSGELIRWKDHSHGTSLEVPDRAA